MRFHAENSRQSLFWFFPVASRLRFFHGDAEDESLSIPGGEADMMSLLSCKAIKGLRLEGYLYYGRQCRHEE